MDHELTRILLVAGFLLVVVVSVTISVRAEKRKTARARDWFRSLADSLGGALDAARCSMTFDLAGRPFRLTCSLSSKTPYLYLDTPVESSSDGFAFYFPDDAGIVGGLNRLFSRPMSSGDPNFDAQVRTWYGKGSLHASMDALISEGSFRSALLALRGLGFESVALPERSVAASREKLARLVGSLGGGSPPLEGRRSVTAAFPRTKAGSFDAGKLQSAAALLSDLAARL